MNPNSSLLWLPKIEAAGLPVPRTLSVPYSHAACASLFDGEENAEFERLRRAVMEACGVIGYPAFIRTDLSSAKHSGPRAYRIDHDENIGPPLFATIEDNEMKFWMEREGPQAILVRQFLRLDSPFTAFRGLPISREWRFFADADRVICAHPYWPADAIEEHVDSADILWRPLLDDLHQEPEEWVLLNALAKAAAKACGGDAWSVDFCRDVDGLWWLLDMARMEASYHWPGCPNDRTPTVEATRQAGMPE